MSKQNPNDLDKSTRRWMGETGLEKPSADFTKLVMEQVEKKPRLYPYKRGGNLFNTLLAVLVPIAYFAYNYMSGGSLLPGGFNLQTEAQPYVRVFQIVVEKMALDMSTPLVPLGIIAIVALLAFDRLILRSLSLNR